MRIYITILSSLLDAYTPGHIAPGIAAFEGEKPETVCLTKLAARTISSARRSPMRPVEDAGSYIIT